jgi:hypothetical protein
MAGVTREDLRELREAFGETNRSLSDTRVAVAELSGAIKNIKIPERPCESLGTHLKEHQTEKTAQVNAKWSFLAQIAIVVISSLLSGGAFAFWLMRGLTK